MVFSKDISMMLIAVILSLVCIQHVLISEAATTAATPTEATTAGAAVVTESNTGATVATSDATTQASATATVSSANTDTTASAIASTAANDVTTSSNAADTTATESTQTTIATMATPENPETPGPTGTGTATLAPFGSSDTFYNPMVPPASVVTSIYSLFGIQGLIDFLNSYSSSSYNVISIGPNAGTDTNSASGAGTLEGSYYVQNVGPSAANGGPVQTNYVG